MRFINNHQDFIKKYNSLTEGKFDMSGSAGPFHNDINWGDSLLGRLINSVKRKIGVGTNLIRIKPLIKRLQFEFDNIIAYSETNNLKDEDKAKIADLMIYEFMYIIHNAIINKINKSYASAEDVDSGDKKETTINDDDYLSEVKNIILNVINYIKENSQKGYKSKNEAEIISILNELVKEIEKIENNEVDHTQEESEEKSESKDFEKGKYYIYKNREGKNILIYIIDINDTVKNTIIFDLVTKKWKTIVKNELIKNNLVKEIKVIDDKLSTDDLKGTDFENMQISVYKPNSNKVEFKPGKYYLYKNKDNNIILLYIISINNEIKKAIIFDLATKKWKNIITHDLKSDKVVKEINSSSGKLSGLENTNYENIDVPLYKPNTNIQPVENKEEVKVNDSKLYKYSEFMRMMDNTTTDDRIDSQSDVSSDNSDSSNSKLRNVWLGMWNNKLKKLVYTEDQVNKIKNEVDNLDKSDDNSMTIVGIDPVIEILKCFNRAYKLHTTQVIPSGRSGGQVSNKTYREYICFGGGTPQNAGEQGGPYRNIKIFNAWENGVLDIMKNRKYQPIFDKSTKLKVGNKYKEGAGPILMKLMRDLLDGEDLYKKSGGYGSNSIGAQNEFLSKYFGELLDKSELNKQKMTFGGDDEMETIVDLSSKIKTKKLKFETPNVNKYQLRRRIFKINSTDDDKPVYFFIQELSRQNKMAYIIYSKGFAPFRKYVQNDASKAGISINIEEKNNILTDVYATKISFNDLERMLTINKKYDMNGINIEDNTDSKMNLENKKITWLVNSENNEIYEIEKFNYMGPFKTKGMITENLIKIDKTTTIK